MSTFDDINAKIMGMFSGGGLSTVLTVVGYIFVAIIVIAIAVAGYYYWYNKKLFNKKIRINELVNGNFVETDNDLGRSVKLGRGGFEVIFLQKRKVYRLAYGGRTGRNTYSYYILPDGYWHNGVLSGQITIDGKIPVISTSPLARAQYTALEKHMDELYAEKKNWWKEYGMWILSGSFIMIMGLFGWFMMKEYATVLNQMPSLFDKIGNLLDKASEIVARLDYVCGMNVTAGYTNAVVG